MISGPKRAGGGGLIREGGLIERECVCGRGGAYSKSYILDEIHNNFPNLTITPIIKTEQEIGFVSPFYKCNIIYTQAQAGNKDEVSIESDRNTKEYC